MALSLYRVLSAHGEVRQDDLARTFADAYAAGPYRGYGGSVHDVLGCIGAGGHWQAVTTRQLGGMGSWGNGAAARVAPLDAWFAAGLDQAAEQAAVGRRHACSSRGSRRRHRRCGGRRAGSSRHAGRDFLPAVAERTPDGQVASRLQTVAGRSLTLEPAWIAGEVGCGPQIPAQDTVPSAIWCAVIRVGAVG